MKRRMTLFALATMACARLGPNGAAKLPARYFELLQAGSAQVEKRLDAEPSADLQSLEARPGWRHFPYSILAPAVLYARRHPDNAHYHDPRMLALAIKIGGLLA